MNLVLIGYRGTGKSTLSNSLGKRLGMTVYHMDAMLEERFGEKIAAYVEKNGWPSFRDEEQKLAEELSNKSGVIIDCGGGVVTREQNMQFLKRKGFVVWLQADSVTIARRIGGDQNRPSLTGAKSTTDEIIEVLEERTPMYQAPADVEIDTVQYPFNDCLDQIEAAWRRHLETMETA